MVRRRRSRLTELSPNRQKAADAADRLECRCRITCFGVSKVLKTVWAPWEIELCIDKLRVAVLDAKESDRQYNLAWHPKKVRGLSKKEMDHSPC